MDDDDHLQSAADQLLIEKVTPQARHPQVGNGVNENYSRMEQLHAFSISAILIAHLFIRWVQIQINTRFCV